MFRLVFLYSGILDDFREGQVYAERTDRRWMTKPEKIEGAQAKVSLSLCGTNFCREQRDRTLEGKEQLSLSIE
jgi:hypothetical protein